MEVPFQSKTYELPDGNTISVGAKRFLCVEVPFQPKTYELPDGNTITVSAKRFCCAEVIRKELYAMSCCQVARPCSKGFLRA